jgi:ubiquinone/menaquinone biosynthesis C-methylase UbiE
MSDASGSPTRADLGAVSGASGSGAPDATALGTFRSELHGEEQERIACPLCGARDERAVLTAQDLIFRKPGSYSLVRCNACGLEYVNPRPTPAALGAHYPDDYFGYSKHEDAPGWMRPFLEATARDISRRRMRYLERVTGRIQPDWKLLDVGCGPNRLLADVKAERGCVGTALDFKPEMVAHVRDVLRMPVVQGTLASVHFEAERFDVVWMMEYLEHEPDPRAVLAEARRVTKRGGHLALELPHIAAWPARAFGRYWWNLDLPRHLVFFPPDTLRRALAEAGFELVRSETFTLPFYAGMSLAQALGLRHWARHKDLYPLLSGALALPLLPFQALMPEFLFAVARAR